MAPNDPSRLISQVATLLRGNPLEGGLVYCVADAINAAVFAKAREIQADLSDTGKYLAFFAEPLEYSIPPRIRRRIKIYTRMNAWNWVTARIKGNLDDSNWMHAEGLGATADVFAQVFREMRTAVPLV